MFDDSIKNRPLDGASPLIWPILIILIAVMAAFFYELTRYGERHYPPDEIGCLEDKNAGLSIDEAASESMAKEYILKKDNRLSLGFNRSALWIRIDLRQAPASSPWVLFIAAPWLDRIDFYAPDKQNGWIKASTGLLQPGPAAAVGGFVLDAPLDINKTGFAYLRLESVLSLNAGIRLLPKDEFNRQSVITAYFYGVLFGVMMAMAVINFLVFITSKDSTYLFYVLYLVAIFFHQICLQGQILYFPETLWPWIPKISLVTTALTFYFGALFCRRFLNTKQYAPLTDLLLIGAQLTAVILLCIALAGWLWWGTWLAHSMAFAGPVVGIIAGVQAVKRGFLPARIYMLAWFVLFLGSISWGAWSMGLLDQFRPPQTALTLAEALECCLLALALADRVRIIELERRALVLRERRYHHLSITDELTGLYNHRHFWERLNFEISRAVHAEHPLSLLVIDLDDFKNINDAHGHGAGDQVLSSVGSLLRQSVRPADSACRYGGEEFSLILPNADEHAAVEVAERVRLALSKLVFKFQDGPPVKVTASIGGSQLRIGDDRSALFKRADKNLYQAKSSGKNRVVNGDPTNV